MSRIWSEDHQFGLWLKVEIAACEAWMKLGVIDDDDMAKIREAKFSRAEYDRQYEETRHDLVSFTRAVATSLGDEGRWIHHGLTSNDVKDTALAMQMSDSTGLLISGIDALMSAIATRAVEFKHTLCMGRSHGIHAEPMSFGLKLALWWSEMRRNRERAQAMRKRVSVGMLSGPVGTFAGIPIEIEQYVCAQLGLQPAEVSNQIIQRDRHAEYLAGARLDRRDARQDGHRDTRPPTNRGRRGRRTFRTTRIRQQRLVVDAAQTQSRALRAHLRPSARNPFELNGWARKRRSLARTRHFTLIGREGCIGGFLVGARLHFGPHDWHHREHDG